MDALLGYTGLVGSHLRENLHPDTTVYFDSKNFKDAPKQNFENVYCACVPAVKWRANKNPSDDFKQLQEVFETLVQVDFRGKLYLFSTIDVHDRNESSQAENCPHPSAEPYGRHRLQLENQLRDRLGGRLVVLRLPALFGLGLKKNLIFDLLEDNRVEHLNVNTAFQWYSLSWLWDDIRHVSEKLPHANTVNLYTMPIETGVIADTFFPGAREKMKRRRWADSYGCIGTSANPITWWFRTWRGNLATTTTLYFS